MSDQRDGGTCWRRRALTLRLDSSPSFAGATMRRSCAYLPPAEDENAAGHMHALEEWIKGPCRAAWRKA